MTDTIASQSSSRNPQYEKLKRLHSQLSAPSEHMCEVLATTEPKRINTRTALRVDPFVSIGGRACRLIWSYCVRNGDAAWPRAAAFVDAPSPLAGLAGSGGRMGPPASSQS